MAKKFNVAATRSAFKQRMRASLNIRRGMGSLLPSRNASDFDATEFSGSVALTAGGVENDPLVGDGSHLVGPVVPNAPGRIGHGAFS